MNPEYESGESLNDTTLTDTDREGDCWSRGTDDPCDEYVQETAA